MEAINKRKRNKIIIGSSALTTASLCINKLTKARQFSLNQQNTLNQTNTENNKNNKEYIVILDDHIKKKEEPVFHDIKKEIINDKNFHQDKIQEINGQQTNSCTPKDNTTNPNNITSNFNTQISQNPQTIESSNNIIIPSFTQEEKTKKINFSYQKKEIDNHITNPKDSTPIIPKLELTNKKEEKNFIKIESTSLLKPAEIFEPIDAYIKITPPSVTKNEDNKLKILGNIIENKDKKAGINNDINKNIRIKILDNIMDKKDESLLEELKKNLSEEKMQALYNLRDKNEQVSEKKILNALFEKYADFNDSSFFLEENQDKAEYYINFNNVENGQNSLPISEANVLPMDSLNISSIEQSNSFPIEQSNGLSIREANGLSISEANGLSISEANGLSIEQLNNIPISAANDIDSLNNSIMTFNNEKDKFNTISIKSMYDLQNTQNILNFKNNLPAKYKLPVTKQAKPQIYVNIMDNNKEGYNFIKEEKDLKGYVPKSIIKKEEKLYKVVYNNPQKVNVELDDDLKN